MNTNKPTPTAMLYRVVLRPCIVKKTFWKGHPQLQISQTLLCLTLGWYLYFKLKKSNTCHEHAHALQPCMMMMALELCAVSPASTIWHFWTACYIMSVLVLIVRPSLGFQEVIWPADDACRKRGDATWPPHAHHAARTTSSTVRVNMATSCA